MDAIPISFEGAYAKLQRAGEHLNTLDQALKVFRDPNTYLVTHEFNRERGEQVWKLDSDPPSIPIEVSTILGDALHNLRCTLDHLVWQSVILNSHTPHERNEFPIFRDSKEYQKSKRRRLSGVSQNAETIIDGFQPYNPGNRPLWALHVLSNTDKHRHVYLTVVSVRRATFERPGNVDAEPVIHMGPIKRDTELCTIKSLGMDMQFRPTFDVAFRHSDPTVIGVSVMETLRAIQTKVSEVLQRLSSTQ